MFNTSKKKNNFNINFIGIGTQRCATSWIFECLKEHFQVCKSKTKEINFFNDDNKYEKGLTLYTSYFKNCQENKIKGEYSPSYMANKKAALQIKKHFPRVKLITCLRNPIERAYSHYLRHKFKEKTKAKSFKEALKGGSKNRYIARGFYYSQLKRYFKLFPKENILVLIYEDITKNPIKFIQKIYKFLDINPNFIPPSINKEINWVASNPLKIPLLNSILRKIKKYLHSKKIFKPIIILSRKIGINKLLVFIMYSFNVKNIKQKGLKRYKKPSISKENRKYLQEIYKKEIKNLEKLTNRDLSFWK